MKARHKKQARRFSINGIAMTSLDFAIFVSLGTFLHLPAVLGNVISTSLTSILSYRINKRWVFPRETSEGSGKKMLLRFFIVTLSGLFILQNIIIFSVTHQAWVIGEWLEALLEGWRLGQYSSSAITLTVAKLTAVLCSSVWNFAGYKFFVFRAGAAQQK